MLSLCKERIWKEEASEDFTFGKKITLVKDAEWIRGEQDRRGRRVCQ